MQWSGLNFGNLKVNWERKLNKKFKTNQNVWCMCIAYKYRRHIGGPTETGMPNARPMPDWWPIDLRRGMPVTDEACRSQTRHYGLRWVSGQAAVVSVSDEASRSLMGLIAPITIIFSWFFLFVIITENGFLSDYINASWIRYKLNIFK